jgi:hypothetical protein
LILHLDLYHTLESGMQHLRLADPDGNGNRSPLGDSLIQIANRQAQTESPAPVSETSSVSETTPVPETAADTPPQDWQKRFSQNRAKITRRLKMIEAELNRMDGSTPSLSVFDGEKSK